MFWSCNSITLQIQSSIIFILVLLCVAWCTMPSNYFKCSCLSQPEMKFVNLSNHFTIYFFFSLYWIFRSIPAIDLLRSWMDFGLLFCDILLYLPRAKNRYLWLTRFIFKNFQFFFSNALAVSLNILKSLPSSARILVATAYSVTCSICISNC